MALKRIQKELADLGRYVTGDPDTSDLLACPSSSLIKIVATGAETLHYNQR